MFTFDELPIEHLFEPLSARFKYLTGGRRRPKTLNHLQSREIPENNLHDGKYPHFNYVCVWKAIFYVVWMKMYFSFEVTFRKVITQFSSSLPHFRFAQVQSTGRFAHAAEAKIFQPFTRKFLFTFPYAMKINKMFSYDFR